MWEGGNQKSEAANPQLFFKKIKEVKIKTTLSQLLKISQLPVMQNLQAMQALGTGELLALDTIEKACNMEIAFLLQHYSPATVMGLVTRYKRIADEDNDLVSHPYKHYLKVPRDISEKRKAEYSVKVDKENKTLRPFYNIGEYINQAVKLMQDHKSYMKIAIGLCALTGRRPGEILVTANFEKVDDDHVIFSGQLKTKESDNARDNYTIPVLIKADKIIASLDNLRKKRDFTTMPIPPGKTLGQAVNLRTAKQQGEVVRGHLLRYIPDWTASDGEIRKLKPYNLRSIYGMITAMRFKPENQTQRSYLAEVFGHSETDLTTSASYEDFYYAGEK